MTRPRGTDQERIALRRWAQAQPKGYSLTSATRWFEGEFKRSLSISAASEWLSTKYKHLDRPVQKPPSLNPQRLYRWPSLNRKLDEWWKDEHRKGAEVTDAAVLAKAKQHVAETLVAGKPFSDRAYEKLLENFKQRHPEQTQESGIETGASVVSAGLPLALEIQPTEKVRVEQKTPEKRYISQSPPQLEAPSSTVSNAMPGREAADATTQPQPAHEKSVTDVGTLTEAQSIAPIDEPPNVPTIKEDPSPRGAKRQRADPSANSATVWEVHHAIERLIRVLARYEGAKVEQIATLLTMKDEVLDAARANGTARGL